VRTVPAVRPTVFDLRAFNLPPFLIGLATALLAATATLVAAGTDSVLGGPGNRVVAWALGGLFALIVVLGLAQLPRLRRPRRLVIDHEGIRVEGGARRSEFRLAWTELAGVGLVVDDRRRRRRARSHHRVVGVAPDMIGVTVGMELVPVDDAARRRHPELARAWWVGRRQMWRIMLTAGPGDPLPVGPELQRHRPELWRGQRSGSLYAALSRDEPDR
jgi:hypothetical protein